MSSSTFPPTNSAGVARLDGHARLHIGNNYSTIHTSPTDPRKSRVEFCQRLSTSPYEDRKDRNPRRAEGTCEWFIQHSRFQHWQQESSSLLWVSADPGCGKSVLSRYLIDDVLQEANTRTVCYFFFKDDFEDQRTVESAICCLLHQLFRQKPELLLPEFLDEFEEAGEQFLRSFKTLWKMLIKAAKQCLDGEIICVLDALDECQSPTRLIEAFAELYGSGKAIAPPKLKFLITSRPYAEIRRGFRALEQAQPTIHLSGESEEDANKIANEITIFIQQRIEKICRTFFLSAQDKKVLQEGVAEVEHRTYLWVYLVFETIEAQIDTFVTKSKLSTSFRVLPNSVEEAYDKILRRSRDPDMATNILHIVTAADRPLDLTEMAAVLALQESHRCLADLEQDLQSPDHLGIAIREICGLFVVIKNSQIFLFHQTAKEFLIRAPSSESGESPSRWRYSLDPVESHLFLARKCMQYLLLDGLEQPQEGKAFGEPHLPRGFIFLDYSANHWTDHYLRAHGSIFRDIQQQALRLCCGLASASSLWLDAYAPGRGDYAPLSRKLNSPVLVASYFGLHDLVKVLLAGSEQFLFSIRSSFGSQSALSLASDRGHVTVVKLLLNEVRQMWPGPKFLLEDTDLFERTPLHYAAKNGRKDCVQFLCDEGANVHREDLGQRTPLDWAIYHSHSDIVTILRSFGAVKGSLASRSHEQPLIKAVVSGDGDLVKLLLARGANTETLCASSGLTSLTLAIHCRRLEIGKLLLDHGADIEARDKAGLTGLLVAVRCGRLDFAKLLLDRGAQANVRDYCGKSALMYASAWQNSSIVDLLLRRDLHLETCDESGWTALMYASRAGNVAATKALINQGANIEALSHNGIPAAVAVAFQTGHHDLAELLLDRRALSRSEEEEREFALTSGGMASTDWIKKMWLTHPALQNV